MRTSEEHTSASPEARQILKGLNSHRIGQRLATEQQLQEMGSGAAELLLQLLEEEAQWKRLKRRLFWMLLSGGLSAAAALAVLFLVIGHPELMGFLGTFGSLGALSPLMTPTQRYIVIINALSQLDDVRAVGPLAEAFLVTDLNARTAIARTLMRLLPRLQPTDEALLNASQRAALRRVLQQSDPGIETDFILVVLQALVTIGDVGALPMLETLARRVTETDNERRVQEAAAQGVLVLEAVRERLQSPQILLRASAAETAPDQLLRAAQGVTKTPPQQLLRAGSSPEEE